MNDAKDRSETALAALMDEHPAVARALRINTELHGPPVAADRPGCHGGARHRRASRGGPRLYCPQGFHRRVKARSAAVADPLPLGLRAPAAEMPARLVVTAWLSAADEQPVEQVSPVRITRRIDVLAAAWSDLFGPEEVRHDADFFELGGTSLLARRLVDRVENESDAGVISAELNFANSAFGALALATDSDEVTSRTEPTDA